MFTVPFVILGMTLPVTVANLYYSIHVMAEFDGMCRLPTHSFLKMATRISNAYKSV